KDADNYAFANDNNEATLTTSFTGTTAVANTLFVYYPYTTNGIAAEGAKVDLPVNQNPTATSFDGKADLMIAKPVKLDASGKQISDLEFARVGAIVKIVLKDNTSSLAGQHVSSLTMTAATDLTGRVYLDVENQELGELYYGQSKSVTATYSEATQYEVNGTNATYVVVYPQTLKSGSKLTIKATTEGYTITKEITLSQDIELAMSKVTTLNVSLEAANVEKNETVEWVNNAYNLVPSTAYLEVGDKVVIVASSYAKGMGLWADGNNCPAVNVTKNTENKTVAIDGSVAVLTVEAGKTAGSFAFKSSKGYLYAASSSSNYLKAEATLSTNSSWSVSIVDGIATVKALGGNTRNWMRYNNSSAIFSCYASGQTDICIYKLVGEYTLPPVLTVNPASISFESAADSKSVTCTVANEVSGVSITATEDVDWLSTSVSGNTVTITATENTGDARNANVTIAYEGAESKTIAVSQAAGNTGGGDEPSTSVVVLREEFDNTTTADSSTAISTSKFPNFSGATSKAYTSKYGGIKLGSSSAVGYITTKSLDLSSAFTVEIDACKFGSDTGNIVVTCGSQSQTINNSELGAAGSFKTFTLTFAAATATSTVKIATSSKRAYIDNVVITRK
ncbi:MAG: BACON domain-containing protein, partial [Alistipes sp.]|nr:BACON domain-containing protein [Alistipes sp.]MBQ3026042.1 BACON domain-containing protein [Alistipes sp.]